MLREKANPFGEHTTRRIFSSVEPKEQNAWAMGFTDGLARFDRILLWRLHSVRHKL